ncbi:hypothetical protein [Floridanema aerugineum]|jgi:hypothetical protein|uniref:Uncharacterized protein n=1 Tax=Floridaenema aerugineum BLCC-F46 TaxID=3153654 RepID=A0ABV4X7B9_9CYAN
MKNKFSLSLCVLTSAIWASTSIPVVFAQTPEAATQQLPAATPVPTQSYNNAVLTAQDLPAGFKELPPEITAQIQTQFEILSTQLAKAGMKPEKYFAFIDQKSLQIVVGFTGLISNQSDRANFDSTLKQMQQPEYQQQMIAQIRQSINSNQGLKILDYGMIPTVNNIADTSTGMTVAVDMQGQVLQLDLAAFRRSNVGAFTAIMYRKGDRPSVNLDAVARQLDTRIVQTATGTIPASANESQVTPPSTRQMQ